MQELWPVIYNISFEGLYRSMILFSLSLFALAYLFIGALEFFIGLCWCFKIDRPYFIDTPYQQQILFRFASGQQFQLTVFR